MKYLKRFNEELSPSTYRSAASKLKSLNKIKRATNLSDFADNLDGFYNMHVSNPSNNKKQFYISEKFTVPKVDFFYGSTMEPYDDDSDLIREWSAGNTTLYVTFQFSFRSNSEEKYIKTFNMQLFLSDWAEGLSGFEDMISGKSDVSDMYGENNSKALYLSAESESYGLFADRKSAYKFKKELPKLIKPHMVKIIDILSAVGADANDIDDVYELFEKIRINNLYDDEINEPSDITTARNNWFSYRQLDKI